MTKIRKDKNTVTIMNTDEKMFKWFDSYRPNEPFYGPYFTAGVELIGSKLIHTESELLKLDLSETIKNRIRSARENTVIKICYLHNAGYLCIRRMTKQEISKVNHINNLKNELANVSEEIRKHIPKQLQDRKLELEKQLRKLKQ